MSYMGNKPIDYATDNDKKHRITQRKQEYNNYCENVYYDIMKNEKEKLNQKLEEMGLLDDNTRFM